MAIQAIETRYKGYRFRSRLEARWAVFFDALGWEYEYEPEGFDLGGGVRYLPDFYLPGGLDGAGLWVEVKPSTRVSDSDLEKLRRFPPQSGTSLVLLLGSPWPEAYGALFLSPEETETGLCVLFPCPTYGGPTVMVDPDLTEEKLVPFHRLAPMKRAYDQARGARFEHGEHGAPQQAKSVGTQILEMCGYAEGRMRPATPARSGA